jgi:hypothetical protein
MKKNINPVLHFSIIAVIFTATCSVRADDATNTPTIDNSAMSSTAADSLQPSMSDDDWKFGLTAPLWFPQIDGNATLRGKQHNVNITYNTLREHLDTVFALALEAHKDKYSIYGDVGYMKFSAGATGPNGYASSSLGLKFLYSDLAGGYQLIKTESDHPFILEGTVGVRYWYASIPISFSDPFGNTRQAYANTWNVVDPVLGFRGSQYFTRKLHLDFQGDGGGFDLNHSSDWTWAATGELSYDFTKWFTLSAGYQALALDESENKANGANGVNFIFHGALVELNFRF